MSASSVAERIAPAAASSGKGSPERAGVRLARGTAWLLAGRIFARLMSYVNAVVCLRFAGVEAWGALVFLTSWLAVPAALAGQGLPVAVMRLVSYRQRPDCAGAARSVGGIRWLILGAGMALSFAAPAGYAWLPEDVASQVPPVLFVFFFAVTVIFESLLAVERSSALGLEDARLGAVVGSFLPPVFRLCALLALLVSFPNVTGLVLASALALATTFGVARTLLARRGFGFVRPSFRGLAPIYRFALPLAGTQFLALGIYQADKILLGYLSDAAAVGTYGIASRVAFLVIAPYWAGAQAFAPVIAQYWAAEAFGRLRNLYQKTTELALVGTGVLVAALFVNLRWVLGMFGPELALDEATRIARVLAVGLLLTTLPGNQSQLYRMSGKSWISMLNTFFITSLNVTLNWFLIPVYGAFGAAMATAIAIVAGNLSGFAFLKLVYDHRIHPFGERYGVALGAAATIVTLGFLLEDRLLVGNLAVVAGSAAAARWVASDAFRTLFRQARNAS